MEKHRPITFSNSDKVMPVSNYLEYFERAFSFCQKYYGEEIKTISSTDWRTLTPEFFWREYRWVCCVSGFNAKRVSQFFEEFSSCFDPLLNVIETNNKNINTIDIAVNALQIFSNKRKIKGIIDAAFIIGEKVEKLSWNGYKQNYLHKPDAMTHLPYIGNITKNHLARNIGLLDFVKEDLHLSRLSKYWGFNSGLELCQAIQKEYINIPLGIIDLILFYTASTFGSKV